MILIAGRLGAARYSVGPRGPIPIAAMEGFCSAKLSLLFPPPHSTSRFIMDAFSLQQFDQYRRCFQWPTSQWRIWSTQNTSPNPYHTSARRAFFAIGLCNVPAFVLLHSINIRTTLRAATEWRDWKASTFWGRLIGNFLTKIGVQNFYIRATANRAQLPWVDVLAFSPSSFSLRKAWTPITYAFTHLDPAHFVSNMSSLWVVGLSCSNVPGLDAAAVFKLSALSAICGSAAHSFEKHYRPSLAGYGLGASGIVCAFGAVAVLGWLQALHAGSVGLGSLLSPQGGLLAWALVTQLNNDLAGLSRVYTSSGSLWSQILRGNIGYSVHLTGVAVGAVYYLVCLRPSQQAPNKVAVQTEMDIQTIVP